MDNTKATPDLETQLTYIERAKYVGCGTASSLAGYAFGHGIVTCSTLRILDAAQNDPFGMFIAHDVMSRYQSSAISTGVVLAFCGFKLFDILYHSYYDRLNSNQGEC